jgi:hypothetical protein
MAPCDDTDDAPDGSIEDLREDFASATEAFREQAQENLEKREAGIPVARRTAGEPEGEPEDAEVKQQPFNPDPVMLVPHYTEGERREIPQRADIYDAETLAEVGIYEPRIRTVPGWEENHPFDSASIEVDAPTMSVSTIGYEEKVITAGEDHTIECTVRNIGGLPARNVTVELFVEHLEPRARLDINEQSGEQGERLFEANRDFAGDGNARWTFALSGTTTMSPVSNLTAVFHKEDRIMPPYSKPILDIIDLISTPERNFAFDATETLYDETESPGDGDLYVHDDSDYYVDIWDTSRITTYDADLYTKLANRGIHLAHQKGRIIDGDPKSNRTIHNHDLTGSVNPGEGSTKRVGKAHTSIPQNGERTVSFEYTPDRATFPNGDLPNPEDGDRGEGRGMTAFYVRAYSLATNELPEDWGELDHTESRFMGRTEVRREL